MKGFVRNNQYLSLCGLNCKLCPMNLAGHCSGCGVDNQSCKIAKCSIEHGKIEIHYSFVGQVDTEQEPTQVVNHDRRNMVDVKSIAI